MGFLPVSPDRYPQSRPKSLRLTLLALVPLAVAVACPRAWGVEDAWPQWGGTPARNNVAPARHLPTQWNVGEFDSQTGEWQKDQVQNVRWAARLGSESYGSPVLAGGRVFCATNNGAGYLPRYPAEIDLGCLLCFRQSDGQFLWQHSSEKLPAGRDLDWPLQGICSNPLVEGDRLWAVTNRGEVVCLDTEGFRDGKNDGPFEQEAATTPEESDIVWRYDLMAELGSVQHNMACCSVTAAGNLLLVSTSNGIDGRHETIPAPQAPSFVALDKQTGKLLWADNSPGTNILHGQWASPAFAVLGGVPQAIFPGGDGRLYSFRAETSTTGKPELLWKFDCNPKETVWKNGGRGDRNSLVASPVVADGLVYIVSGEDPDAGEGRGILWCIDPTRRGDVSPELVVDRQGQPVPPRRLVALDRQAGEQLLPNPNSAERWHYGSAKPSESRKKDSGPILHRSLSLAAISEGLLVLPDRTGLVHCLDAQTGKLHWTHDLLSAVWGSPLVADGRVYLGNEDGEVVVFALSDRLEILGQNAMGDAVYGTPTAVGETLYIATRSHLFAVAEGASPP